MKGFIGISIVVFIVIAILYFLGRNTVSEGFETNENEDEKPKSISVSMYHR